MPARLRTNTELVLPGTLIGLLCGAIVGGLAAYGGLPAGTIAITTAALGVPLAAAGAGYELLVAAGRLRLGGIAPAALYWLAAFTAARLVDQGLVALLTGTAPEYRGGIAGFVVWQAIVGSLFSIGYLWIREHISPLWWVRIAGHNPVARRYVEQYTRQAVMARERKERQRARRPMAGPAREPGRAKR
ncbi:MAG: hypothetical protein LBI49_27170 [Nocardiopsaceae bacterium]|nr:hypothetical protein [Nocardiopsaceae bacterium]